MSGFFEGMRENIFRLNILHIFRALMADYLALSTPEQSLYKIKRNKIVHLLWSVSLLLISLSSFSTFVCFSALATLIFLSFVTFESVSSLSLLSLVAWAVRLRCFSLSCFNFLFDLFWLRTWIRGLLSSSSSSMSSWFTLKVS